MCGRYVLGESDIDAVEARFMAGVRGHHAYTARYNVAPSQVMPIVRGDALEFLPWGFAPSWSTHAVINARIESLEEKPYFRAAQHCLVPATGFYEWKRTDGKVPYYFHLQDDALFAFAGICNEHGYAIVTLPAQGAITEVHDRMPFILDAALERAWLEGTTSPTAIPLAYHAVSRAVNSPRNDAPELTAPDGTM